MNGYGGQDQASRPSLTQMMLERHTTRAFLPDVVPRAVLEECLALAQQSPSNSNVQPWRMHVLEGASLARLEKALHAAVDADIPQQIAPLPDKYKKYRSELGHRLYGEEGYNIPREAKEELERARRRNYDFFGAPMGMVICHDSALALVDTLAVGLWLQTLCLLLQERGISHAIEVSVAGYPDVIRKELAIDDDMLVLCGLAIGYEDRDHRISRLRIPRDHWKDGVTFVDS